MNSENHRNVPEESEPKSNGKDVSPCGVHVTFMGLGSTDFNVHIEGKVNAAQLTLVAAELNYVADQLRTATRMKEAQKHIAVPSGVNLPSNLHA